MSVYRQAAKRVEDPKPSRLREVVRPLVAKTHDALVWLHKRVAPKRPKTAAEVLQEMLDSIEDDNGTRG